MLFDRRRIAALAYPFRKMNDDGVGAQNQCFAAWQTTSTYKVKISRVYNRTASGV
jgi:hypothetical protein